MAHRRISLTDRIPILIASLFLYISVANGTLRYHQSPHHHHYEGDDEAALQLNRVTTERMLDGGQPPESSEDAGGIPSFNSNVETPDNDKDNRVPPVVASPPALVVPEEIVLTLKESREEERVVMSDNCGRLELDSSSSSIPKAAKATTTTAPTAEVPSKGSTTTTSVESIMNGRQYLVATLDGKITLLNVDGTPVWSVMTEKSFDSSVSALDLSENGRWMTLIPSLSGGIYRFDGEDLSPMPMNVESLLQRSFKLPNDVILTGGKELKTYGIDLKTGKIRYECGISGCSTTKTADDRESSKVTLVLKKQLQTVRAVDSVSGVEKWNFSVGTNEVAFAGAVCQGGFHTLLENEIIDTSVKVGIPEGKVFGVDSASNILWEREFGSPISEAWLVEKGQLVSIDPILNNAAFEDPPSFYVGMHNRQLYVQESHMVRDVVGNALVSMGPIPYGSPPKALGISWKVRETCNDEGTTAITSYTTPGPPVSPFFVFERDRIEFLENSSDALVSIEEGATLNTEEEGIDTEEEAPTNDFDFDPFDDEFKEDEGPIEIIQQVIIGSVWYWWKEILGISLFTTVILNILILKPLIRSVRMETVREVLRSFNIWYESERGVVEEAAEALPMECALVPYRGGGDYQSSTISSDNDVTPRQKKDSFTEFDASESVIPFISTYLKEFEPIQCLGKGAFGIVFEAKKRIDDRNYAVKRIALPDREKDRERVMREVKALAQLEHRNIVRYFNAWIEHPPKGWLEQNDPLWNSHVISSVLPTCDLSSSSMSFSMMQPTSDIFDRSNLISLNRRKRLAEYDKTVDDDSFIVFEASNKDLKSESGAESKIDSEVTDASSHRIEEQETIISDELGLMYLYIQQELCHKRTLQHWLKIEKCRNKLQVMKFFAEIVDAVEYVHSKKLIHRDLKPGNIFLSGNHDGNDDINVKIGDFGLVTSALVPLESPDPDGSSGDSEKTAESPGTYRKSKVHFTGNVGTYLYMSPEQSRRRPYDYKVDIYSLGLIFYELLVPFSTDMERYDVLTKVKSLQFPSDFEKKFSEEKFMIEDMISHNPNDRPDATAVKEWIRSQTKLLQLPRNKSKKSRDTRTRRDS